MPEIFIDRRSKKDRRAQSDPSKNLSVDLYGRMRRKSKDRRAEGKTLIDDYEDYLKSQQTPEQEAENTQRYEA
jgi:hypothetical protein